MKILTRVPLNSAITCLMFFYLNVHAQSGWTWTELPNMPFHISNNAVSHGMVNDTPYVYTFSGIDTTKLFSGINLTSMRYNTVSGEWSILPDLPDTLGKIAAAASTINNIIYIMGGYHVFENSSELSSNRVHRFNPETNTYLSDGANIPVPIDDQVQVVWRDSLIFLITGWSNNGNVNNVQIYNPYTDSWAIGTPTPNNNIYKAFGASGTIVGDTIYYNGGATGGLFNSTGRLRKGVINPLDPVQIEWSYPEDNPGEKGYRMASMGIQDHVFWVGGSGVTYNFDGIAYNGSGGVDPLHRILQFNASTGSWIEGTGAPYGIMDLRGIARIDDYNFIICGGMMENQEVTNRAFQLTFDPLNSLNDMNPFHIKIFPNPISDYVRITADYFNELYIYNGSGKLLNQYKINDDVHIDTKSWLKGNYLFVLKNGEKSVVKKIVKL